MQPTRLTAPDTIPSNVLDDWGPAKEPLGDLLARIRAKEHIVTPGVGDRIGVWECSPGRWRRQVMEREFAYFLSGQGWFIPDQGEPIRIVPHDAIWFPEYTTGIWEITETVRKIYFISGFRNWERRRNLMRTRIRKLYQIMTAVTRSLW